MKNLLTFILIHLVDNPDDVKVEEVNQGSYLEYIISVNPEDMGQIIGRQGRIIQSIRNIAKIRAIKEQRRISISIAE